MKKLLYYGVSALVILFCFIGCGSSNIQEKKSISKDDAQKIISNYLNALLESDIDKIKKYSTDEQQKSFNEDILNILKNDLKSIKLIKCEVREDKSRVLIDTEVEIICADDFIAVGDWMPGKTVSKKTFELVKVNNDWKVNGWGVYP